MLLLLNLFIKTCLCPFLYPGLQKNLPISQNDLTFIITTLKATAQKANFDHFDDFDYHRENLSNTLYQCRQLLRVPNSNICQSIFNH